MVLISSKTPPGLRLFPLWLAWSGVILASCSSASRTPISPTVTEIKAAPAAETPGTQKARRIEAKVQDPEAEIRAWCADMRSQVAKLKWQLDPCPAGSQWQLGGLSVLGRALVYQEFGDPEADNVTLMLMMIHADEVTPLYLGLSLAHWLIEHRDAPLLVGRRVVIAPMVNPDAFFKPKKTRVNARGVDVNRNFATRDWHQRALRDWKTKYRSDPRRFPGHQPESEPETIFQRDLIRVVRPQKILSIHAPLSMMDYDGPDQGVPLARLLSDYSKKFLKLQNQLKNLSWQFYPGSLGNFAGRELGIPTMTLELPTADPAKAASYWQLFKQGARSVIEFRVDDSAPASALEHQRWKELERLPPSWVEKWKNDRQG